MTTRLLVFTDLDGTLLDEASYSFAAALPALAGLKRGGHLLVFCTSKTFAECRTLQRRMEIEGPLIVENGGGIHLPAAMVSPLARGGWKRIPLGIPYRDVRRQLSEVREELGLDLAGLGDLGAGYLEHPCGLTGAEAEEAMQREFDEPFLMPAGDAPLIDRVIRAFAARGLQVSRGGRFFHLSKGSDKGRAVRLLANLLQESGGGYETVGLGDSPNDLPMLGAVKHPFLVMRPGGFHDPSVLKELSGVKLVPAEGAAGWNQAVLGLLAPSEHGPRRGGTGRGCSGRK